MNLSIARKNGYFGGYGINSPSYNMVPVYNEFGDIIKITKEEFAKGFYESIHKNKSLSDITKKRISEANKGKVGPNRGINLSIDTKRKISEANKGKKLSDKTKEKLSKVNKNLTTAKDIYGNKVRVTKDDTRFSEGLLFGINTKRYKILMDGSFFYTRNINAFIIEHNLPGLHILSRFIGGDIINYKLRNNYCKKNINGMRIYEIEWLKK